MLCPRGDTVKHRNRLPYKQVNSVVVSQKTEQEEVVVVLVVVVVVVVSGAKQTAAFFLRLKALPRQAGGDIHIYT